MQQKGDSATGHFARASQLARFHSIAILHLVTDDWIEPAERSELDKNVLTGNVVNEHFHKQ